MAAQGADEGREVVETSLDPAEECAERVHQVRLELVPLRVRLEWLERLTISRDGGMGTSVYQLQDRIVDLSIRVALLEQEKSRFEFLERRVERLEKLLCLLPLVVSLSILLIVLLCRSTL